MSFTGLSPAAFWLGLLGLAGVLVLLQILRVRHAPIPVVTTLFWQEALEEARARVFRRVFRHWPAWLLVFGICSLLWLAIARPTPSAEADERTVLVLDASAGMQRGTRFEQAKALIREHAEAAPAASSEVLVDAGGVTTLLAPGEDRLLLARRLERLAPQAAPSSLTRLLPALRAETSGRLVVRIFGDAALALGDLPADTTVERVDLGGAGDAANAGITALGVREARSGTPGLVDIFVEVRAGADTRMPTPLVSLDGRGGQPLPDEAEVPAGEGRRLWRLLDQPAAGGLLHLTLASEDDIAFDDEAWLRLPNRPRIRVQLDAALTPVFGALVDADPQLDRVEEDADVTLATQVGATAGPLLLVRAEDGAAIEVHDAAADADALLHDLYDDLGLAAIDGAALAQATGRAIDVVVHGGDDGATQRRVALWGRLLDPELGFVHSRAFPLVVSRALRWLAGQADPVVPFLAAHDPFHGPAGRWQGPDETITFDAVGADVVPPIAGVYAMPGGTAVGVSLLDATLVEGDAAAEEVEASGSGATFSIAGLLMFLAFLLLGLEWFLVRTGRMP